METAIGVFASRDRAEVAVKELRQHMPDQSIVFLTRSETEATRLSKQIGGMVGGIAGGATGLYAGIVASLLVPGLGSVFALGAGAAAILGLAGAGSGRALGETVGQHGEAAATPAQTCPEDVAFFREVLKEGRSLIVVRTESKELAATACDILDRLGLGMKSETPAPMHTSTRKSGDVTILDITGRITVGEGSTVLRGLVEELIDSGNLRMVFNLGEVHYIDSSGLGELVKTHTTVKNRGGQLKLANVSKRVDDLLRLTRLASVFDIEPDEASAVRALEALEAA